MVYGGQRTKDVRSRIETGATLALRSETLTRAAQAHLAREPAFAEAAGFAALRWLVLGFGYEITSLDVWSAYHVTLKAAETLGHANETKVSIREVVQGDRHDGIVCQILGRELGLS